MTYEPGKLREDAARYDRMGERLDTDLMRAHASALEKLKVAEEALAECQEDAERNRKDAERYRKLRSTTKAVRDDSGMMKAVVNSPEQFDAAIDAARGKK